MNREDIITAASKAGFETKRDMIWVDTWEITPTLARFAALVAAAEREACAKVCDARCIADGWEGFYADECAAEIRARGQEMERKPANAHDKVYSEVELADAYQKGWNDAMLRSSLGMARSAT
jgi:hypothetical protein